MVKNKKQDTFKKTAKFKKVHKINKNIINAINSKIVKENCVLLNNTETHNETIMELMMKYPSLNETFEYILYSNKYKHSLTDVFNIVNMLLSKLEDLKNHDVKIDNIFETINFNYKIKGLVQSTAINLSHVLEQLNSNESTFLSFAHNFSVSQDGTNNEESTTLNVELSSLENQNDNESTFINDAHTPLEIRNYGEKVTENIISSTSIPEEPRSSISPICNYNQPNVSKEIKTENIMTGKHNTIFGGLIVLSDEDEYEEEITEKKNIKIDDDISSYILGSEFTDIILSDDDNIISSSRQNQDNSIPSISVSRLRNTKKNKKNVSDEVINESRKADFNLRRRINNQKHLILNIVDELKLKPNDIILEFDIINKKPLVTIHHELAKVLKKHQVDGIRFLWNTIFETVDRTNTTDGTGCILAHRMGIGKTLQIITLIYTLICHSQINIKTFLIICPPGLIYNWMDEIYKWLKDIDKEEIVKIYDLPKTNKLYNITNIAKWKSSGGILILSYENFKSLVNCKQNDLQEAFSHTLINPGPDVVILDEGHYIKNSNTILLKSLTQIKTKRRIVLSGTPIQNNLREYFTLVNFVKPHILGNFKEFNSTFIKPIERGIFVDSSEENVQQMKHKSFILNRLLQNTVHRIDENNLRPLFTEKIEYTVELNLTEFQTELYEKFLNFNKTNNNCNAFLRLHVLTLITLHPLTLYRLVHYKNNKQHLEYSGAGLKKFIKILSWIQEYGEDQRFFESIYSNKIIYLLNTIDECMKRNEKILCFLKSPLALDAIEYFLHKDKGWIVGVDYFRMDGKSPILIRNQMCESFNNSENTVKLFIISLGTGVLGYNMIGANRVLLLNTSWNPSLDIQAIYRCLRFGQKKTVYVNRVLAKGTVEPKAYYRQIKKLGICSSVVDMQNMSRKVSYDQTNDLFTFDRKKTYSTTLIPNTKDTVLNQLIRSNHAEISNFKEHDSMLVASIEDQLTNDEKKNLWLTFKNKEVLNSSFIKPKPLLKLKNTDQQQNINNQTPRLVEDIKQEIDCDFSESTNSFQPKMQCSAQNINESSNSKYFTHSDYPGSSQFPSPARKHIQFSDTTIVNNSTHLTPEFKSNNLIDKRSHWKKYEEPIKNQFRHFTQNRHHQYKRWNPPSNFRQPYAARNSANNEQSSSNHDLYDRKRTWSTPTENNLQNRSGMHR